MNQRMLELALLAGLKKAHGADREYMGDFDWREFADLIVRECASLLPEDCQSDNGCHASWTIKEHFGVDK